MNAFGKIFLLAFWCFCFLPAASALDILDNQKIVMRITEPPSAELPTSEISVNGKKFPAIQLKDLLEQAGIKGDSVELQGESRTVILSWDEATSPGIYLYFTHAGIARIHGPSETLVSYPGQVKTIRVTRKTFLLHLFPIGGPLLLAAVTAFVYFKRDWQRALILFFFTVFIYWQFELPCKGNTSDNLWYVPTSLSILHQHNLELSEYHDLIEEYDGYGIHLVHGAPYNIFPVGTSILTLPLVWLGESVYRDVKPESVQVFLIAAFAARIIAALSVALLFLLALRLTRKLNQSANIAVVLALLFAFCTTQFGIHGGGLWSHNVVLPLLLLTLLCLQSENPRIISLSAVPLALAYITRPTFSVHIVLVSIYILLYHRKSFLAYALMGLAIAGMFIAFSYEVYHSFLPPYYSGARVTWAYFLEGLAANLISPNRGLLIFSPIFVASFYGIFVSFRYSSERSATDVPPAELRGRDVRATIIPPFFRLLSVMAIVHWAAIGLTRNWWAGVTVGPRFFSDILPVLILLLIPAHWALQQRPAQARRIAYSAFAVAVAWSFFVQIRTATSQEVVWWNRFPVAIGLNPERVWDWRDMQILRTAAKRFELNTQQPRPHPDILLITIDTLRADHLGCYGYGAKTSPVIDQVASRGVRFENAFSAVPLTLPSHATILSGLYPNHHGIRDNAYFPSAATVFIQESLKQSGYQTAAFVSGAPLLSGFGLTRGFDIYDDDFQGRERKANATTTRAIQWIHSAKQPFFLWVHYFDPHAEYDPPEPYKSEFHSQPYDGEIAFTDHELQRLLQACGDQTFVIITADHGESLGEHGEKTHGVFLYNATLHVPLILYGPSLHAGVRKDFVTLADIAPTVLELANAIRKGRRLDGTSLFAKPAPRNLFAESLYAARNFGYAPLLASIRSGKKFIDAPLPEFFDLGTDPSEERNLFHGADVSTWQKAVEEYKQSAKMSESRNLDPEEAEKLRSLGYIGNFSPAAAIDPKTKITTIEDFNQGLRFLNTGDFPQAEKTFREISKSEKDNSAALRFLGDSLTAQGKLKDAAAAFDRSLQRVNDPEIAVQLAKTLEQLGETDRAETTLKRATRDFPDYNPARFELASLYANGQDWPQALTILNRGGAEDFNQRGILYLTRKDPQRAIAEFQKAIAAKPDAKFWNNLGIAFQQAVQLPQAEDAYTRALQLNPDYQECEANLAFLLIQQAKWQDAEYHLLQVTSRNPKLWQARMALGFAAEKQGQMDRAMEIYEQLLQDAPVEWAGRAQLEAHLRELQK